MDSLESDTTHERAVPRRVWSGTALQAAGRFWTTGCTLTYFWLAARQLTAADFGRFTFYLAVFSWLDSLANMGTGQVAVQLTAGDPARTRSVLRTARRVRLSAGLFGVALVGVGAFASAEPGAGWILLAALYPVTHTLELSATVFRNRIAWGVPVMMRSIASGLSLVFVWLCVRQGIESPAIFLVAVAAGSASANFLLHFASQRHLPPGSGEAEPLGRFLRAAVPLGLGGLCAQTYFYIDNLFVRAICGEEPLGHYNVAVRVLSALIMLAQYSSLTALAWFTRRHLAGELGPAVARLAAPLFSLAGLGCGLLWPWTEELLELFRPGFGAAGDALRWLLLAVLAIYAGSLLHTAVIATGATRAMFWIAASGLAINVGLNAWLVPVHGIDGAAAATFATELSVTLGAAWTLHRAGVSLGGAGAAWRWLGGPLLLAAGAGLSSLLPFG